MSAWITHLKSKKKDMQVTATPQRPRSLATEALASEEISHLAKHIIKITLWPDSSYVVGWKNEIETSLDNLVFKLCRYSTRKKNEDRIVKQLWYSTSDIMERLDTILDDCYWRVIDDMKSMLHQIEYDPFVEDDGHTFSSFGYHLKEEKNENGSLIFVLWLDNEKIT